MTYWVVVAAAGVGQRMQADCPKQYLPLAGSTVIEQTIARLRDLPGLSGILVSLAADDVHWQRLRIAHDPMIRRIDGGSERCHSVLNALCALDSLADPDDWVLVHDAARPCVHRDDLQRLTAAACADAVGALLAYPVRDTMKRQTVDGRGARRVGSTENRVGLWHALTPQLFRLQPLREALQAALAAGQVVTDEAEAMERRGWSPMLVEGRADNIKVTRSEDLMLAEFYLRRRRVGAAAPPDHQ